MKERIEESHLRCQRYLRKTPLEQCLHLSAMISGKAYLKMEQQQVTGSFKARGAYSKILSIPKREREGAFFVAASTGNHAAAFCHALKTLGLKGKVFLPENVARAKLDFIKSYGIPFELHGSSSLQTEIHTRQVAEREGFVLVHPYNDPDIIAGQGTIGLEILEQLPDVDVVIVPVGGGGLMAGIASYIKSIRPEVQLIGCQPRESPEMVRSIEEGHIILEDISRPTLSDGTAGGMEQGSITFPICQELVDDWILIDEDEMASKLRWMMEYHQILVEGAACLSLAALDRLQDQLKGKKVVCIICGKRIGMDKIRKVLCG